MFQSNCVVTAACRNWAKMFNNNADMCRLRQPVTMHLLSKMKTDSISYDCQTLKIGFCARRMPVSLPQAV